MPPTSRKFTKEAGAVQAPALSADGAVTGVNNSAGAAEAGGRAGVKSVVFMTLVSVLVSSVRTSVRVVRVWIEFLDSK
jgi:hypothetical protein